MLVVGAGVSGLAMANWLQAGGRRAAVVIEADSEPGGYCKTIVQDGFVWDYSGHFFHFRRPDIEAWLTGRMPGVDVRTVVKRSFIRYAGRDITFPFQKNIHQLPREDFIDCLYELYFRDLECDADRHTGSFLTMLYRKFGRGIADRFLVPYNEKLYACDLNQLDADAMGRFFPYADIADIIRNMRTPDNASYNDTFRYPAGGAIEYIHALVRGLAPGTVRYGQRLQSIDRRKRVAHTSQGAVEFTSLVSSAPLNRLAAMAGIEHDDSVFAWNKVLVFNLGFDRKGASDVHWMYFPDRQRSFYRVGWYDNIVQADRMSLYVEIGATRDAQLHAEDWLDRVLSDLRDEGLVTDHKLVSWHSVVLDPAYVHITEASNRLRDAVRAELARDGVYSIGRYGGWTYCSIEDNIVEARALAKRLSV